MAQVARGGGVSAGDPYLASRLEAVGPAHLVVACQALINRARLLYQAMQQGTAPAEALARYTEIAEALLNLVSVVEATPKVSPETVRDLREGLERVLAAGKRLVRSAEADEPAFHRSSAGLFFSLRGCQGWRRLGSPAPHWGAPEKAPQAGPKENHHVELSRSPV